MGVDQSSSPNNSVGGFQSPGIPVVNESVNMVTFGGAVTCIADAAGRLQVVTPNLQGSAPIRASAYFDQFQHQLLSNQIAGWGASTGGARGAVLAGTATLAQVAAALAQLLEDLKTHGVLAA